MATLGAVRENAGDFPETPPPTQHTHTHTDGGVQLDPQNTQRINSCYGVEKASSEHGWLT